MAGLFLVGIALLGIWAAWSLYIAGKRQSIAVSLVLQVEHGEEFLDPLLQLVWRLFREAEHLSLSDVWVVSNDDGGSLAPLIQRLQDTYPLLHWMTGTDATHAVCDRASGQVTWVLDLTRRLTPLQAVELLGRLLIERSQLAQGLKS
ncbi:MAG: hypothetical protein ACOX18_08285 [Bacillota bacterium]|jgi:hypothetical protein